MTSDVPAREAPPAVAGRRGSTRSATLRSAEWPLLLAVAAIGAVARAGGFSSGTLYRDDAWVALTTRVPLGTAARMVVTTPGFVLGERVWIGWFPHTLWVDQLPTFLASVAGIVVVGRLARWWGLSVGPSLVAATLVALSQADVQYATRVKPYAFDLLGACLVLWLAERVRREGARVAPWLALASVCVCAFSLTPVPLVVGIWVALAIDALARRRLTVRLGASGLATAVGLGALYLAVRGGISPRLRTSWDGYYLVVSSPRGFAHSAHTIVQGLVTGVGETAPTIGVHGLGTLDRAVIIVLFVLGLAAWRRQLLALAALAAAVLGTIPSLVPLGTGRTDAFLYPAIALVVAEGAALAGRLAVRVHRGVAVGALCASLVVVGLLAADRVEHRPSYPGGDFTKVTDVATRVAGPAGLVIIGGTARWPWSYYDVDHVQIAFSDLYNNGYTTLNDQPNVLMLQGSAIEGGYESDALAVARRAALHCGPVVYVESDDWATMPMTLLHDLTTVGGLTLVRQHPTVVDGYRYWLLRNPRTACFLGPLEPSAG